MCGGSPRFIPAPMRRAGRREKNSTACADARADRGRCHGNVGLLDTILLLRENDVDEGCVSTVDTRQGTEAQILQRAKRLMALESVSAADVRRDTLV